MARSVLDYTWETYTKNFGLILLAALPGLFGLLVPIIVGLLNHADPLYMALGGAYLRTGSIVDLGAVDALIMVAAMLFSIYLMSFAMVGINLVVKRQRTLKRLSLEQISSVARMTNSIFVIYLIGTILMFIVQLLTYENGWQGLIAPFANLLIGIGMLFIPTAIVMDEARAYRAMQKSFTLVLKRPGPVLQWLAISLVVLSVLDGLALLVSGWLTFLPYWVGPALVLAFNSLIILPYSIVLLAQIYISKYTILVD